MAMRATILGALAEGQLTKLPKSAMGSVLWEASLFTIAVAFVCCAAFISGFEMPFIIGR